MTIVRCVRPYGPSSVGSRLHKHLLPPAMEKIWLRRFIASTTSAINYLPYFPSIVLCLHCGSAFAFRLWGHMERRRRRMTLLLSQNEFISASTAAAVSLATVRLWSATVTTTFSHLKSSDTDYVSDGLREFFLYRDLGVAKATNGKVVVQLVKANLPPETGTGWHYHTGDYHVVYMLRGWAKFMYEDKETLVAAGDCVQQRPGIVHYLFDYSPDMEFLEIVSPANFCSIAVEGPCAVPPVSAR